MNVLALYLKEVDYKKVGKKEVPIFNVNFTDKRIVGVLRSLGYRVDMLEYDKERLRSVGKKYDLIFNLADGLENDDEFVEIAVLKEIEKLGVPFTGNSSRVIRACYDKSNVKRILLRNDIKTPAFQVFKNKNEMLKLSLRFPFIVKPLFTDGGVGIDDSSVVYDRKQLRNRVARCLKENKQPALVEEYIDGRDFCVPVIGGQVLPPVECTFSDGVFHGRPRIMTYDVKWGTKSRDYRQSYFHVRNKVNRNYGKKLKRAVERAAGKTFDVMGCSGYATVDIRVNNDGEAFVIEINPNCWIDKNSDSAKSARSVGISYPNFIDRIVKFSKNSVKK